MRLLGAGRIALREKKRSSLASGLLALTERVAIGGNSWENQGNNLDYLTLAWWRAGCRGVPTAGMRQARGGDRLSHLVDRIEPIKSVRAGLNLVMNPINDFTDTAVTNDNAGGDIVLSRLDTVTSAIQSVVPTARFLVMDAVNASGILAKATARARVKAGMVSRHAADPSHFAIFDPNSAGAVAGVDLTSGADSSDSTHPNQAPAVVRLGKNLGPVWASYFDTADIFAGGLSLTNNKVTFNPATAWTVTANSSGLSVSQAQDTLRDRPSIACRRLTISGTTGQDPTLGTTAPDLQLRLAMSLPAGFSTDGKHFASIFLIEITDSSGGDPTGVATLQFNNSWGQAFAKQLVSAEGGYLWDEKYSGVAGIMTGATSMATGQTGTSNFDIRVRGKLSVATNLEIRIAAINLLDTDAVAYGPVKTMSKAFTIGDGTNRPVLRSIPTTTPSGGSVAVGATIAKNGSGHFVGGGLTHQYDALRDGTTDVGDMTPALNGVAAVPYTTVAGDSAHTIVMRDTASNGFAGGSSDSIDAIAVTVT
jgi:hypothetical protein